MPMLPVPPGQNPEQFKSRMASGIMGLAAPLQVRGAGVPGSRSFAFDQLRNQMKPGEEEFLTKRLGLNEDEWIKAIAEDRVRNAMAARNLEDVSKTTKSLSNISKAYARAREQVIKLLMEMQQPMGGK